MIRIHRKAHVRRKRGKRIHVKATTYLARDRGKRGRGKPFLKRSKVKKNILGQDFFGKSATGQKRRLAKQVHRRGERAVQGQLQYVANLQKRTNPKVAARARVLRRWVARSFKGRKRA